MFRSAFAFTFATFLSRVLGFAREILTAQVIGAGVVMSAWSFALMLPNTMRRIFGEGALGTALVPILTHTAESSGPQEVRKKFSTVAIWLFFILVLLSVIVSAAALAVEPFVMVERWKLTLLATPMLMPYCILICLIGAFTSLLNTLRIFFLPAMAGLLLNLMLIAALLFICPGLSHSPLKLLSALSGAVLISGVLELLAMVWLAARNGMLPKLNREALTNSPAIRELWQKMLPGIIGFSAVTIGTISDRCIAMTVGDYANSAMYYSDRLVYLPIGLFAVAFGTVSLPYLSKLAAEGRIKTMLRMTFDSIRELLFITVPLTLFMVMFSKEIIGLFYQRGKFDETALYETWLAMFWLACGIPAFALIKLVLNAYYSRKEMKIPAIVSCICLGLNITLSILLKYPMKQGGIALATSFTSYLNIIILLFILRKQLGRMPLAPAIRFTGIIFVLSFAAMIFARFTFVRLCRVPGFGFLPKDLVPFLCACCVFGVVYMASAMYLRLPEAKNLFVKLIIRRKSS